MGEMVSIERSRFEDLLKSEEILEALEDAQTMRIVAAHRANLQEGLPHAFMVRILNDENPVAVYREWRGLTQTELARKAGLHRVQVHDIETGKRTGSVKTLKAIADALNLPLDDLV